MPNRVPFPPLERIFIITQSDQEAIAQSRQAIQRSMQILAESRSLTGQLRLRTGQTRDDRDDQNAAQRH